MFFKLKLKKYFNRIMFLQILYHIPLHLIFYLYKLCKVSILPFYYLTSPKTIFWKRFKIYSSSPKSLLKRFEIYNLSYLRLQFFLDLKVKRQSNFFSTLSKRIQKRGFCGFLDLKIS